MSPPSSTQPEPWLRGTLSDIPPEQRAVLHALQLAQEDVAHWCGALSNEEFHASPLGLPSVAFQLQHIAGSLDRLLTYAEGGALSEEQKRQLSKEAETNCQKDEILAQFGRGIASAEVRVRAIDPARWPDPRAVGRKQLPTTVAGLLIHCADHTQRHVGQAVTTAKVLLAMQGKLS